VVLISMLGLTPPYSPYSLLAVASLSTGSAMVTQTQVLMGTSWPLDARVYRRQCAKACMSCVNCEKTDTKAINVA
jgi:hypothetical protein